MDGTALVLTKQFPDMPPPQITLFAQCLNRLHAASEGELHLLSPRLCSLGAITLQERCCLPL